MKSIFRYLRGSYDELRRVIWPNRQQALTLTGLVLVFSALMAAYLAGFDLIFRTGLEKLLRK